MDPFGFLSLPLRQPWETGWGAALSSDLSEPPDVVTAATILEAQRQELFASRGAPSLVQTSRPEAALAVNPLVSAPAMENTRVDERKRLLGILLGWLLSDP
eukprot:1899060-Amphidinium_carterae.1